MAKLLSRRRFGGMALSAAAGIASGRGAVAQSQPRVIVIGGGYGGGTAAKYLRVADAGLAVTLVEPSQRFVSCPFSNHVLAGLRTIEDLTHDYATLADRHGVKVVRQAAVAIDPAARRVQLTDGTTLPYDRLIVSPGVDLKWSAIDGYSEAAAQRLPHAWKSGEQTLLLRRQIEAMPNGGVFVLVAPPTPYRCPPGPYERASLVAYYFQRAKPKSKILILDAKDQFSEQGLFEDGWAARYPGMIEWVPLSQDGRITEARPAEMTVISEFGEEHKGDVINIIPPQYAGQIARDAGLANQTGWCPVDPVTFESTIHKDVHVIGDACIAGAMPKGAFAANTQAKAAVFAIVSALRGRPPAIPTFLSSCYSLVAPDYGLSVIDVFRATPQGIVTVPGAGGGSRRNGDAAFRAQEARYADGWYASITTEIWHS